MEMVTQVFLYLPWNLKFFSPLFFENVPDPFRYPLNVLSHTNESLSITQQTKTHLLQQHTHACRCTYVIIPCLHCRELSDNKFNRWLQVLINEIGGLSLRITTCLKQERRRKCEKKQGIETWLTTLLLFQNYSNINSTFLAHCTCLILPLNVMVWHIRCLVITREQLVLTVKTGLSRPGIWEGIYVNEIQEQVTLCEDQRPIKTWKQTETNSMHTDFQNKMHIYLKTFWNIFSNQ